MVKKAIFFNDLTGKINIPRIGPDDLKYYTIAWPNSVNDLKAALQQTSKNHRDGVNSFYYNSDIITIKNPGGRVIGEIGCINGTITFHMFLKEQDTVDIMNKVITTLEDILNKSRTQR